MGNAKSRPAGGERYHEGQRIRVPGLTFMRLKFRLFILAAVSVCVLPAQSEGVIEGLVRDPSGSSIPGASVTLTRIETGVSRSAPTDEHGMYRGLALDPGTYRVAVKAEGFAAIAREGFELSAGRTLRADFDLVIGAETEVVNVVDETPLLSGAANDWGGLVSSEKLAQLPLNGRDLFELAGLEPGATQPTSARVSLAQGIGGQRGNGRSVGTLSVCTVAAASEIRKAD